MKTTTETLSNTETALLGLLNDGAKHPYQIEQEVQQRDMRYWTDLSQSSIYKLLPKLEERGIVVSETEISEENRARKIYTITKEGRKALKAKIKELIGEPEHIKWSVDIAISNLSTLTPREAVKALQQYRKGVEQRIKGYKALNEYFASANCPDYRFGLATRPIRIYEGELKWVDEYIAMLKKKIN